MEEKCNGCDAYYFTKRGGDMCASTMCIKEWDYDPETRMWTKKKEEIVCSVFEILENKYGFIPTPELRLDMQPELKLTVDTKRGRIYKLEYVENS